MNFDYNEEQQLLADSVRRFLAKDYTFEARKKIVESKDGWSPGVWAQLTEMGLMGLPFSPDYGGFGGGAVDLMGVMEAAGDAMLVEHLPRCGRLRRGAGRLDAQKIGPPAVVEGSWARVRADGKGRLQPAKVDASEEGGRRLGITARNSSCWRPRADTFVVPRKRKGFVFTPMKKIGHCFCPG
jgi:alkylation response protein AidB-like acyl-CoA dehydrogenase